MSHNKKEGLGSNLPSSELLSSQMKDVTRKGIRSADFEQRIDR